MNDGEAFPGADAVVASLLERMRHERPFTELEDVAVVAIWSLSRAGVALLADSRRADVRVAARMAERGRAQCDDARMLAARLNAYRNQEADE